MSDATPPPIFDHVYTAPDVVRDDATLAAPPGFEARPDGLHLILYGTAGRAGDGGRVVKVDRLPPLVLVHVLDSGPPDDPYDRPLSIAYLVRADALLTLRQVADRLKVGRGTVRREIGRGLLEGQQIGGAWYVSAAALTAYVAQQTRQGEAGG